MQAALPADLSHTPARAIDWRLGIPTYAYAVVFASFCIVMGLLWDIMWHMSIGRDGLFSEPHVVMYVGAVVSGLFSAYQILNLTFRKDHPDRVRSVNFWGVFYGSLGAMYCVWGALAMLTSAPFDDWWHSTYGLDVQILTPPHTVLLVGMMMVQLGAIVAVLSLQNQAAAGGTEAQKLRIRWLFVLSAAFMLSVLFVLVSENLGRYASHNSSYYINAAIIFPVLLLAIGRAAIGRAAIESARSGSVFRYPITLVAAIYMLVIAAPSWVLSLMPATPKLGPVANPITTYQAFIFPLLLVIPAFALDWVMQRFSNGSSSRKPLNDWLLAGLTGAVFLLVFLAVQWPFGGFLHESPYARNWFFMSNSWGYYAAPDWQYRYKFSPWFDQTGQQFAVGFGKALLIAMISARIGLWWGNWMRRVVR